MHKHEMKLLKTFSMRACACGHVDVIEDQIDERQLPSMGLALTMEAKPFEVVMCSSADELDQLMARKTTVFADWEAPIKRAIAAMRTALKRVGHEQMGT